MKTLIKLLIIIGLIWSIAVFYQGLNDYQSAQSESSLLESRGLNLFTLNEIRGRFLEISPEGADLVLDQIASIENPTPQKIPIDPGENKKLEAEISTLKTGDRVRVFMHNQNGFSYVQKIKLIQPLTLGGFFMNAVVTHYSLYLILSILLTLWVGRTLYKNGRVFLLDAFGQNEKIADSINHLLLVGFYLINFGYASFMLQSGAKPEDLQGIFEALSMKIGIVLLILGAMHFLNLYIFSKIRKRYELKEEVSALRVAQGLNV